MSRITLGLLGIRAAILLVRGTNNSYRAALYVLVAGTGNGFFHMVVSRLLRGSSMPVDAVVFTTILTLVVFLLYRIPFFWQGVDFTKRDGGSSRIAGGATAIMAGLLTLTIQFTMGSTHTWDGINYAGAFNISSTVLGWSCLVLGIGLIFRQRASRREIHLANSRKKVWKASV